MLNAAQLQKYYDKYDKEKVDGLVEYLSYKKKIEPLPKNEFHDLPIMYVFRHGQSVDNKAFVYSGWRTAPLTKEGRKQAEILAEKLKDKKLDLLIASPQVRALETMKIAVSLNENAKNLEINTDERIKERSYGELQGQSKLDDYLEDFDKTEMIRRSFDHVPPNGESIEMVCKRVANFCDEMVLLMKKNHVNIAVSCHGNSFRGFRKYFENLSDEETAKVETPLAQDYAAYEIK